MSENFQYIPCRVKNASVGGHVAGAEDIIDDTLNKEQSTINSEVTTGLGDIDTRLNVVEQLAEISVQGGDIGIATASDFETRTPAGDAKIPTVAAVADGPIANINEKLQDYARVNGYYATMGVGIAKNLEGRSNVTDAFFERTTGGDAEVANGLAQLQEVQGGSVKFNQLFPNTPTCNNNGSIQRIDNIFEYTVVNVIGGYSQSMGFYGNQNVILGHKYFVRIYLKTQHDARILFGGDGFTKVYNEISYIDTTANVWKKRCYIGSGTLDVTNQNAYISLEKYLDNTQIQVGDKVYLKDFLRTDLTAIFGSGNEPSTVEDFEAWLAQNVGLQEYYDYTDGEVVNNNMTGIESIGFNLLDPATGKAEIIGAYSEVYGNYYGITGTYTSISFTDRLGNTSTITPDADGKFELDVAGTINVADRGADCAVFLWWDGTKTEYEDYVRNVGNLDIPHIYGKKNGVGELVRVWPTGMPKVNDIVDKLCIVDGAVVGKRNVGELDMGTQTWYKDSAAGGLYSIFYSIVSDKAFGRTNAVGKILTANYITVVSASLNSTTAGLASSNKSVMDYSNTIVYIRDDAHADSTPEQFKTAVTGQKFYFELATPETYTDLVYMGSSLFDDGTPVTLPVNYVINNWGVERILPKNTSTINTAKPTITCKYSIDAVEQIDSINTRTADINPDTVPIISKAFAYLKGEIDSIKQLITDERIEIRAQGVDSVEYYKYGVPFALVSETAGAPSAANVPTNWDNATMGIWTGVPRFVGQVYIDQATTGTKVYLATKVTNTTSDWVVLN